MGIQSLNSAILSLTDEFIKSRPEQFGNNPPSLLELASFSVKDIIATAIGREGLLNSKKIELSFQEQLELTRSSHEVDQLASTLFLTRQPSNLIQVKQGIDKVYGSQPLEQRIEAACREGYEVALRTLLEELNKSDIPTDEKKELLERGLLDATENGHVEAMKVLLDKGANIEVYDNNGFKPLHVAAKNSHVEAMKILLDRGADIEAQAYFGHTSLHLAALGGHVEAMKILLDEGVNIEAKTVNGHTPLHCATGSLEAVKLLLEAGADKEAISTYEETILYSAVKGGNSVVLKELLDRGTRNNSRVPLLILAAVCNHVEVIKVLLEVSDDVDVQIDDGETPLNAAARVGSLEAVKVLLKAGANKDLPNSRGETPLDAATKNGHDEVMKVLRETEEGKEAAPSVSIKGAALFLILAMGIAYLGNTIANNENS